MTKEATPAGARPRGRLLTKEESLVRHYQRALHHFVDDAIPGSHEAYTMAYNAIRWLILKDEAGCQLARRWVAQEMYKLDEADSEPAVIIQIEYRVRIALDVRRAKDGSWGDPQESPARLYAQLAARFPGKSVPNAEQLAEWLDHHSERKARGKITTTGIVAKIVHAGRLFSNGRTYTQTLDQVTKALDRRRHPRW